MRYLFFDTETNGLPRSYRADWTDSANWPRIVQLAWLACDDQLPACPVVRCEVIKPDGWEIPERATLVHGISTARALEVGRPLREVLAEFWVDAISSQLLVAHNFSFDQAIVGAELTRLSLDKAMDWLANRAASYCTMKAGTNICLIPGPYGYKWPQLCELYRTLFGREPEGQHSADGDVLACAECFFEMAKLDGCQANS